MNISDLRQRYRDWQWTKISTRIEKSLKVLCESDNEGLRYRALEDMWDFPRVKYAEGMVPSVDIKMYDGFTIYTYGDHALVEAAECVAERLEEIYK